MNPTPTIGGQDKYGNAMNVPYTGAPLNTPTVISNYGMNKKVGDITSTFQNNANTSIPSFPTGTKRAVYAPSGDGYTGEFLGYAGTPQEEEGLLSQFNTKSQTSYGTDFTAPEGAQLTPEGNYLYQGQYYTKDQLGSQENLAAIQNTGLQRKKYDEALQSQLDSINKRFDQYKKEQQAITESGAAGATTALLQSGAGGRGSVAQYAAVTADARVNSIMSDGQKALADLDAKRDELLATAKSAYADKDYKLLSDLNTKIEANRKEMLEVTKEANKELAKATAQATKDTSIASVYEQGITDPTQILSELQKKGIKNVTLKDITDAEERLIPTGIKDLLTTLRNAGAPADVIQKVLASKDSAEAYKNAGTWASTGGTGVIGEYNFYRAQALAAGQTPVDFNTYQNMDANRKAKVASAGVVTAGAPTSYKEWELAGKPGTYADYLKNSNIKAPTVAQQTVAEYAVRLEQAIPLIESQEKTIQGMNIVTFNTQKALPSALQSSEMQQYMQAARNFINAKLRRESGAVISPTEFTEAQAQYLPQPGDSDKVLANKKANRDLVYASLKKAAGNAYESVNDLLGTTANDIINTEKEAEQKLQTFITKNPSKAAEVTNHIKVMEKQLGRPITTLEFYEAFPEYQ